MSKEEFITVLKDNELEVVVENGVIIVLYEGGMLGFEKAFAKSRRLAKKHGYVNSIGARAKEGNQHEASDQETV